MRRYSRQGRILKIADVETGLLQELFTSEKLQKEKDFLLNFQCVAQR